jgi:cation diffusion facilitator family transporter
MEAKEGEGLAWFNLFINLFFFIFKFYAGIVGKSQALLADALESISDFLASTVILTGVKIAARPKDEEHPYGHGKAEDLSALAVSLLIIGGGVYIAWKAFSSLTLKKFLTPTSFALFVAAAVVVSKTFLFFYFKIKGERLRSPALLAASHDHGKDALTSLATIVGVFGAHFGYLVLDPLAALFSTFFIFLSGSLIFKNSLHCLMDGSPSQKELQKAVQIATRVLKEGKVEKLRARRLGRNLFIDIIINVPAEMSVKEGHNLARKVKEEILSHMQNVEEVMVHVNPAEISKRSS